MMWQQVVRSWWVLLFGLLCYGVYDVASLRVQGEQERLRGAIAENRQLIGTLDGEIREMEERLAAYDDPALMEQVLMAKLGLVPKGQRVYR
ncbi:MAG: hypothetical protein AB7F31_01655 [Parachlamydiales bacterium]